MPHRGYRKLRGTQDPIHNDGRAVNGSVVVPHATATCSSRTDHMLVMQEHLDSHSAGDLTHSSTTSLGWMIERQ